MALLVKQAMQQRTGNMGQLRESNQFEVPSPSSADIASDMISRAAELCAGWSETCPVMHGRRACVF
jgi:hypothetical protein